MYMHFVLQYKQVIDAPCLGEKSLHFDYFTFDTYIA